MNKRGERCLCVRTVQGAQQRVQQFCESVKFRRWMWKCDKISNVLWDLYSRKSAKDDPSIIVIFAIHLPLSCFKLKNFKIDQVTQSRQTKINVWCWRVSVKNLKQTGDHDTFIAESGLDLNNNANTVTFAGKVMDS